MEDYHGIKQLKRKDLEHVSHDFSDFSLSPARKIRRLDAELPTIIEEEEVDFMPVYEQSVPQSGVSSGYGDQVKPLVIEELPSSPENDEKAIVLFKPMNNPHVFSQGNYSVDPNLVSFFKNQAIWGDNFKLGRFKEDEAVEYGDDKENGCRVVIPWVPSQALNSASQTPTSQTEVSESMEDEEMEAAAMMEIEDQKAECVGQASEYNNLSNFNGGLQHQWHQQHCMIPQPPQNTTTPIVWYR